MEQLQFGDRIWWECVNGPTSGIIVGVVDNLTLQVDTGRGFVLVSVYSIKKVEHKKV
ncbi:MAG: hypothetical protein IJ602_02575 [Paludibacteraceae bacterium]|nr:hypothetical protein [Paludibacteraceae bacterium]